MASGGKIHDAKPRHNKRNANAQNRMKIASLEFKQPTAAVRKRGEIFYGNNQGRYEKRLEKTNSHACHAVLQT